MFLYTYSIHDKFEKVNRKIKIGGKNMVFKGFSNGKPGLLKTENRNAAVRKDSGFRSIGKEGTV